MPVEGGQTIPIKDKERVVNNAQAVRESTDTNTAEKAEKKGFLQRVNESIKSKGIIKGLAEVAKGKAGQNEKGDKLSDKKGEGMKPADILSLETNAAGLREKPPILPIETSSEEQEVISSSLKTEAKDPDSEKEKFIRKIEEWSSKRWDKKVLEQYGGIIFHTRERIVFHPDKKQLNQDFDKVVEEGYEALLRSMMAEQGGLTNDEIEHNIRNFGDESLFAYGNLQKRRVSSHLASLGDSLRIDSTEWHQKWVAEQKQKEKADVEKDVNENNEDQQESKLSDDEKRELDNLTLERWCMKKSINGEDQLTLDKKQIKQDREILTGYRGRDVLLLNILVYQKGLPIKEAEQILYDKKCIYSSGYIVKKLLHYNVY